MEDETTDGIISESTKGDFHRDVVYPSLFLGLSFLVPIIFLIIVVVIKCRKTDVPVHESAYYKPPKATPSSATKHKP